MTETIATQGVTRMLNHYQMETIGSDLDRDIADEDQSCEYCERQLEFQQCEDEEQARPPGTASKEMTGC